MLNKIIVKCFYSFFVLSFAFYGAPLQAGTMALTDVERRELSEATDDSLLDLNGAGQDDIAMPLDDSERGSLLTAADDSLLDLEAGQDPGETVTNESPYANQNADEEAAAVAAIVLIGAFVFVIIIVGVAAA